MLLSKLRGLTAAKLSELALTIRLHQQGKGGTTREITLSGIGKEQMEGIRALSAELLALETQRVAASRHDIYRTLMLSRIGIAALSGIVLLALFMYLRQRMALTLQQQELQRALQAERDRLEVEVKQRTAQLTELTHHLQTAREDERNRLARNLHDELGALLTSAKLDAARIKSRLAGSAPEALERLAHLVDTLNSSIALGRRIIEDLRWPTPTRGWRGWCPRSSGRSTRPTSTRSASGRRSATPSCWRTTTRRRRSSTASPTSRATRSRSRRRRRRPTPT